MFAPTFAPPASLFQITHQYEPCQNTIREPAFRSPFCDAASLERAKLYRLQRLQAILEEERKELEQQANSAAGNCKVRDNLGSDGTLTESSSPKENGKQVKFQSHVLVVPPPPPTKPLWRRGIKLFGAQRNQGIVVEVADLVG
ncbi:uncharacterized protein SPPG_06010 [Spizellomyces punctatus DAOM BR117]|uniref:Uncharacterized protein n=1 Tax=Spizellomyces punctatus (strain DAOM BR117) TaxID=645134 RepID=A0A0L0HDK4_SPIPD|nr:uncharacterized protein SPPG_06010 [Spizellomyces punctatus DAOM BR117]KNC99061.1 hypothetical protein SPPG_06010 [Spizellomyces punctatus DAOM BR117]|eukprot:XP_016607101.1 hypothetical protein SPPG_06010 [Spizellomyces punctatus DAOM BR117]